MGKILLLPPVAFIIVLAATLLCARLFSKCGFARNKQSAGSKEAYECGEDYVSHMVQPDYSQFFPFAFFFTILHVVALVITTVPAQNAGTLFIVAVYVIGAITSLFILLREVRS